MSLPVFKADSSVAHLRAGDQYVLTGTEARHAATVRRLGLGELLDVVDGAGHRLTCTVVSAAKDNLELTVDSVETTAGTQPEVTLVQALAKGDRDLQAVESCTELGVDRVIAWQADRSVARFRADRQDKQLEKWRHTITAAAKQSRRSLWPELGDPVNTRALVQLVKDSPDTMWWILHEQAQETLVSELRTVERNRPENRPESVGIVVGPEGGISDAELHQLRLAGARTVLLGPQVLRSSTAGAAAVVLINAFSGRWA